MNIGRHLSSKSGESSYALFRRKVASSDRIRIMLTINDD